VTAPSLDAARRVPASGSEAVPAAVGSGWTALLVSTVARTLLVVVVALGVWSQLPVLLGWHSTVVMSGSMSPHLRTGDVAVVRPIDPTDVRVGQVLLVEDPDHPDRLRLHRLVGLEDGRLRLQGDANSTPDSSLVDVAHLQGVGVLRVPGIGLPVAWAGAGQWSLLVAAAAGSAAVLAAAGWSREPARPRSGSRPVTPGRPGAPVVYSRSRVGPLRRHTGRHRARSLAVPGAVVGLLALVLGGALLLTTAFAGYAAATANSPDSWGMSEAARWGCVDQSAARTAQFMALTERSGTTAYNTGTSARDGDGTYQGGVLLDQSGPLCGSRGRVRAVTLDGTGSWAGTAIPETTADDFTTQVWFRTTVPAGKLFQLNGQLTASAQYDRHVYLTPGGALVFGVYNGGYRTVSSPAVRSYADGVWHLATASLSGAGMHLYVDGVEVAANAAYTAGEPTSSAYWWFGTGQVGGWPSAPATGSFTGSLASAAVWDHALTPAQVAAQYRAQT
jgi:signal peptidase I